MHRKPVPALDQPQQGGPPATEIMNLLGPNVTVTDVVRPDPTLDCSSRCVMDVHC